jgi:hypothetical protein
MRSSQQLEDSLSRARSSGLIVPRSENNPYLKVSYKGSGTQISEKWNVKIYTSGSVVCNDTQVLQDLMKGSVTVPDQSLFLLQIDDAGWGFCLCGVMVGLTDGKSVWTDTVDVSFFKSPRFEKKQYLQEYANKGLNLLTKIGAKPTTHRIEICTGYVNSCLRDTLREKGFDVRVTEIKGLLQDDLERLFKEHVIKETGVDLAYDPKEMRKQDIGKAYYQVLDWGKKHAPHLLKTGWESMK